MKRAALKIISVFMAFITLCCVLPAAGVRVESEAASQISMILAKAEEIAKTDPHAYDGYCLKFCGDCYEAAGYEHDTFRTAFEAGTAWIISEEEKRIPVGALVFYDYTWNKSSGHVAIYAGDGMMYDAESQHGGVQLRPFVTNGYRGWGWYNGIKPTGDLKTFLINAKEPTADFINAIISFIKRIVSFFTSGFNIKTK